MIKSGDNSNIFLIDEKERLDKLQIYIDNYESRKLGKKMNELKIYNVQRDLDLFNSKITDIQEFVNEFLKPNPNYDVYKIKKINLILERLKRILWSEEE